MQEKRVERKVIRFNMDRLAIGNFTTGINSANKIQNYHGHWCHYLSTWFLKSNESSTLNNWNKEAGFKKITG